MIFKILLIIFLIGVLTVGFSAAKIVNSFREGMKEFRDQVNGKSGPSQARTQHKKEEQTVIDRRNSAEASRKIFQESEGEYVEFEEQKGEPEQKG
ncbi:MAG: DUF4834 family protein [Prevotella sp.]